MTAARVLLVTHSSSLATPSGRAPRHKYLGSMIRFTNGMADLDTDTDPDMKVLMNQDDPDRNPDQGHPRLERVKASSWFPFSLEQTHTRVNQVTPGDENMDTLFPSQLLPPVEHLLYR